MEGRKELIRYSHVLIGRCVYRIGDALGNPSIYLN